MSQPCFTYATAQNIVEKTLAELHRLNELSLAIAYLGLETGDDKILHIIVKGNMTSEMKEASLKIKRCGPKLSTIAMLGVSGQKYTEQHIENTTKILSETCPEFFSFLTTYSIPGTPYHTMVERAHPTPHFKNAFSRNVRDFRKSCI